ncbi:MAG: fatty acid CoA ligase family protein [Nitrospinota bacterium]
MLQNFNIAVKFDETAARLKDKTALIEQHSSNIDRKFSFQELKEDSDRYVAGFKSIGIKSNDRVLIAIKPSFEFVVVTLALFKVGAIVIFIDPGMGKSNLLNCVKLSAPSSLIGINKAIAARYIYRSHFKSVEHVIKSENGLPLVGIKLTKLKMPLPAEKTLEYKSEDETAAILFTTGSTGPPKGVVYTHQIFNTQLSLIKDYYQISDNDIDLVLFPLFGLFSIAIGATAVIPDIDFTQPSKVDPKMIIDSINEKRVTYSFGSPAAWIKIARFGYKHKLSTPTMKRVLMAGAPVSKEIHEKLLRSMLVSGGKTNTPFGSTEALPITDIEGEILLQEDLFKELEAGNGICVGKVLPHSKIMICKIDDEPRERVDQLEKLDANEIGEILVAGDLTSKSYFNNEQANRLHKVIDDNSIIWHRTGDVGRIDDLGRLWFLGRKSHRVISKERTFFTIAVEAIFNRHQLVERTALVGVGKAGQQRAMIIIELKEGHKAKSKYEIANELYQLGSTNQKSRGIKDFLFYDLFPTDIRHNAKIFREKLSLWASTQGDAIFSFTSTEH